MRSPFPVPYGWFEVGRVADLDKGAVAPLEYFGRHLVLWRDDDGEAHLMDAFCPHLGGHLGHGGTVKGDEITCPFHGWRFDGNGDNSAIPYSDRVNKKACIHNYPLLERNGLLMAWYHPFNEAPQWEIPEVPEFDDLEHYTEVVTRSFEIEAPWQDLAENGVDSAHFRYVHNTDVVPEVESYEMDGPLTRMRSAQKFPTPKGTVDGRIDVDVYGPGFALTRFSGIVDTVLIGCNTPINANRCRLHFNFTVKRMGDDKLDSSVGEAFVKEVTNQVIEDKPIWENKAYLSRPALADTDGPFMKFRKWASQFYAEGIDDSAEVYPPEGSYPAEERELTASKKHGTPH